MTCSARNDSHFTLQALFSTVLLVAEMGTGKSLLSLKATENRSLWAGRSFSLQLHNYRYSGLSSSTRVWRGSHSHSLSLSLHCLPPPRSMVRWKPFGCLSLQALAPEWRAESLTRIQLVRKTSGIWWWGVGGAEMAVWELSSQPEQRKKEALRGILFITNAWRIFCMCMSFYFELAHTHTHTFLQGEHMETGCFPTDYIWFC